MKITIKTVRLEAVKDRKVETILFVDTESKRHCIELAKTEGYKILSSEKKAITFEMDYVDATAENIFEEVAERAKATVVWDDIATAFTALASDADIAHLMGAESEVDTNG